MTTPLLETSLLTLRGWQEEDVERLHAILQEPGIFQYFPKTEAPSRPWVEKYIRHQQAHWRERGYGHWAVILNEDEQVVGWCGLEYLPELEQTEVAYLLSARVRGRGLASQAAQAAVAFGFERRGLEEIIGLVHPENGASIRVLEKCGLTLRDRLELWGIELLRYGAVQGGGRPGLKKSDGTGG